MAGVATNASKRKDHYRGKPRHGRRVDVTVRAEEAGGSLGPPSVGYTKNLGAGGAFLVIDEPSARGTRLELTVSLPGSPLVCRGEVRWTHESDDDSMRGMGVRFVGLEVEQIVRLNDFLNGLLGSD